MFGLIVSIAEGVGLFLGSYRLRVLWALWLKTLMSKIPYLRFKVLGLRLFGFGLQYKGSQYRSFLKAHTWVWYMYSYKVLRLG